MLRSITKKELLLKLINIAESFRGGSKETSSFGAH